MNRTEIARECAFALAVLRQNAIVKARLEALELSLFEIGLVHMPVHVSEVDASSSAAVEHRMMLAKGSAEHRVKSLEEQNATLRAEVDSLRAQLARYRIISDHLSETGRLLLL